MMSRKYRLLCLSCMGLLLILLADCRRIAVGPPQPSSESLASSDAGPDGIVSTGPDRPAPLPDEPPPKLGPTVILISLDGFRWDYSSKVDTPHLDQLRRDGASAKGLIPSYPSKTFPNHYTIVTGLYPSNHGIVSNSMYDPVFQASFSMTDSRAVTDGRWWEGEPIWVTASQQGQRSATMYWPGSEALIQQTRPTYWQPFSRQISHRARIEQLIAWLTLPPDKRPTFLTLYLSEVDSAGHDYGPDSVQVKLAVQLVDASIGQLVFALQQRGLLSQVNLIITSDHGMAALSPDRRIYLADYIDTNDVFINDFGSILGINPKPGKLEQVYTQLKDKHPEMAIYKREEVPERLHYRSHRRIPEIIGVVSPGWVMERERGVDMKYLGTHGYDPEALDMHGIFIAHGPAFRKGATIPAVQNIHLYALMCHILQLTPAANDGQLEPTKAMLR